MSEDNFSLHYTSMDNAIHMLSALVKCAFMANVDLKLAFRMVPVQHQDWKLLGMKWKEAYYVDTCHPFGIRSAPYLFNQFAEALYSGLSTIWMTTSQLAHQTLTATASTCNAS